MSRSWGRSKEKRLSRVSHLSPRSHVLLVGNILLRIDRFQVPLEGAAAEPLAERLSIADVAVIAGASVGTQLVVDFFILIKPHLGSHKKKAE